MPAYFVGSREEDIDMELKGLIRKMLTGEITKHEQAEMQHLQAERAKRMMPNYPRPVRRFR